MASPDYMDKRAASGSIQSRGATPINPRVGRIIYIPGGTGRVLGTLYISVSYLCVLAYLQKVHRKKAECICALFHSLIYF